MKIERLRKRGRVTFDTTSFDSVCYVFTYASYFTSSKFTDIVYQQVTNLWYK